MGESKMNLNEYLWFWKTSWSYMRGLRTEFWLNIIQTTFRYRKIIMDDKKDGHKNEY